MKNEEILVSETQGAMRKVGLLVPDEVATRPRLPKIALRREGVHKQPVGDGRHGDAAIEATVLVGLGCRGHIAAVRPSPNGNALRIDKVQLVLQITHHFDVILHLGGAQLMPCLIKQPVALEAASSNVNSRVDEVAIRGQIKRPVDVQLSRDALRSGVRHAEERRSRKRDGGKEQIKRIRLLSSLFSSRGLRGRHKVREGERESGENIAGA